MGDQPVRILYIDDYPLDRALVRDALTVEAQGFELVEASDREEAEALLAQDAFDLVLSDFNILGFTGLQVLDAVRKHTPDTPVMILTGTGSEEIAAHAIRSGASDYVIKTPNAIRRLPHAIEMVLERRRSERAREESERRYRTLFERMSEAVLVCDLEGRHLMANRRACELLGYSHDELMGMTMPGFVAQGDVSEATLRRLLSGESLPVREIVLRRSDGTLIPAEISSEVARDQQNRPLHVQSLLRDISAEKQAEAALQRRAHEEAVRNEISRVFLTAADDDMYDMVLRIVLRELESVHGVFAYLDEHGSVIAPSMTKGLWDACNVQDKSVRFPRETWGDTIWARAILGKRSLWQNEPSPVPEGHLPIANTLVAPILSDDEAIGFLHVANRPAEYGRPEEEWLEGIAAFIAPVLKARLQRDRQEARRRAAEIELRESRERYALLFDTSSDAIFVHGLEDGRPGRFVEVNEVACLRLGYSREELLRMAPQHIDAPEMGASRQKAIDQILAEGHALFEMVQVAKNGERLPVEMSSRLFRYKDEIHVLSVARDITERLATGKAREELQKQLLQAQKMESVGRLAGGVAHDFNNMLSVILGYGENALDRLHQGDPLREDLTRIIEAANRSAGLTRQLLAFSRKQPLQPEVLDLNSVLRKLEQMLGRVIGEDIDLKLSLADDAGLVLADPGQIEQVIMNLVVNARDAMTAGGELRIETTAVELDQAFAATHRGAVPGSYVRLAVTDSGCGMSDEIMANVFEPFFTTKETGEGTGLGLSMVYGIVQQSGGNIWVSSEPGRGSTFEVFLPRTEASEARAGRPAPQEHLRGEGEHILVVEDEESLRSFIKAVFPRLGYKVTAAANGGEALLLIEEKGLRPDLLMTDVVMPSMSGRELVDRIRRTRPDLKVLYMSGYAGDTLADRGVFEPGTPFIQKPFSVNDVAARIRAVLYGE